jgi:hypothetical protein
MIMSLSAVRRVAQEVVGADVFDVVAVTGRGDCEYAEVVLRPPSDPLEYGPVVFGVSRRTSEPRLRADLEQLLADHVQPRRA